MVERAALPIAQVLPRPSAEYSVDYQNQLVRAIVQLQQLVTGIGYLRGSGLFLPGLPIVGYGLRVGEVFSNHGVLTIVREGDIWLDTFSVSVEVGTVTVVV